MKRPSANVKKAFVFIAVTVRMTANAVAKTKLKKRVTMMKKAAPAAAPAATNTMTVLKTNKLNQSDAQKVHLCGGLFGYFKI